MTLQPKLFNAMLAVDSNYRGHDVVENYRDELMG